jgi:hypothetical protein
MFRFGDETVSDSGQIARIIDEVLQRRSANAGRFEELRGPLAGARTGEEIARILEAEVPGDVLDQVVLVPSGETRPNGPYLEEIETERAGEPTDMPSAPPPDPSPTPAGTPPPDPTTTGPVPPEPPRNGPRDIPRVLEDVRSRVGYLDDAVDRLRRCSDQSVAGAFLPQAFNNLVQTEIANLAQMRADINRLLGYDLDDTTQNNRAPVPAGVADLMQPRQERVQELIQEAQSECGCDAYMHCGVTGL